MRPEVGIPEDLERYTPPQGERAVEVAPAKEPSTPREWIRSNLFSTWPNGLLTVALGAILLYLGSRLARWIFVTADWGVVKANLRVYMIGRFPLDEAWRVWACGYFLAMLAGVSWGVFGPRLRWTGRSTALRVTIGALAVVALAYLLEGARVWLLTAGLPAFLMLGLAAGRAGRSHLRPVVWALWALAFPVIVSTLMAFGGVPPRLWGGFALNVLVAAVAILLSFPVGILLAIGRRSTLPAVRVFCVGTIELIRGVPLFTLIVFGQFILPLMLPPGVRLETILTQMLVFTIFSSAYVAEIVRGGLQGVPVGQFDAARALGLSTTRTTAFIVLPQALRSTIPPMISHFISLFKDTSLLAALSITELLRAARRASAQLEFIGDVKEALLAAAVIFWVVAFSMSRWSQRLERRLGVGER